VQIKEVAPPKAEVSAATVEEIEEGVVEVVKAEVTKREEHHTKKGKVKRRVAEEVAEEEPREVIAAAINIRIKRAVEKAPLMARKNLRKDKVPRINSPNFSARAMTP